jgi:hypothetical protein
MIVSTQCLVELDASLLLLPPLKPPYMNHCVIPLLFQQCLEPSFYPSPLREDPCSLYHPQLLLVNQHHVDSRRIRRTVFPLSQGSHQDPMLTGKCQQTFSAAWLTGSAKPLSFLLMNAWRCFWLLILSFPTAPCGL